MSHSVEFILPVLNEEKVQNTIIADNTGGL